MCAVGCIIAELWGRKPLFPGKDFLHTLNLIVKVVGTPSESDIASFSSEKAKNYLKSIPYTPQTNIASLFPSADPLAVDLIARFLVFK